MNVKMLNLLCHKNLFILFIELEKVLTVPFLTVLEMNQTLLLMQKVRNAVESMGSCQGKSDGKWSDICRHHVM